LQEVSGQFSEFQLLLKGPDAMQTGSARLQAAQQKGRILAPAFSQFNA